MRYLILGGAGFIGSNLIRHLIYGHANNQVVALDDFSTGSRSNFMTISQHPQFEYMKGDIADSASFEWAAGGENFDVIYNLACPASPVHYQADPIKTILTTTQGVYNALRYAQATGARFFQASTSEVYGDPKVHPQPESYHGDVNTWGPRACYDEGKRLAETLCYEFRNTVDLRIGRIFNTYGPFMAANDGRVVSNFILQALRGEPITIYGSGKQTRSFQYVTDLIHGISALMISGIKEPINLGTTFEFTIEDLAYSVIRLTQSSSTIEYKPLPQDDPKQRRPDNRRLINLGWEPRVTLEEGLTETIEYFKAYYAIQKLQA